MKNNPLPRLASLSLMIMVLLPVSLVRAQSPFFTAVTNLNPVAYWPLQETAQPPVADIETNYGSLGAAGDAYYSSTNVIRGQTGVTTGDGDTCVKFWNANGNFLGVPTTDNRVSLTNAGAFTVEAWVQPTNTTSANEAWVVVNNSSSTGLNGSGNLAGWTLVQNFIPSQNNFNFWGWTFHVFNGAGSTGGAEAVAPYRYTANTWYHLVGVYDGTNAFLYVNGVLASSPLATGKFLPDRWDPLTIGAGWQNTRGYAGWIDEVAIYTNALMASQIQNHFNNVGSSTYSSMITGDNAFMYWRMDAPPAWTNAPAVSAYPVAANFGSAASGNGLYLSGTTPGVAGPSLPGFGLPSYACAMSPIGTDATNTTTIYKNGNSTATLNVVLNSGIILTNLAASLILSNQPETLLCWFKTDPSYNGFHNLVGLHGDSGARLAISSGQLQWYSGAGGNVASTTANFNDGNWHFVAGVYTNSGGATPYTTGANFLYVDGVLVGSATNTSAQNPTLTNLTAILGGAINFAVTGNGNSYGDRFFDGSLAHVAFFTNALMASQIANLYTNATQGVLPSAPFITGQPITGRTNSPGTGNNGSGAGSFIFLGVNFIGATSAQWYFNGGSNYAGATILSNGAKYVGASVLVPGATSQQMTISNLVDSDSGYYYVVLANSFGSVTSILASFKVSNEPYIISQVPAGGSLQLYPNQNSTISVTAGGTNLVYQWFTNNIADITAGTASSYALAAVQPAISGSTYYCVVTNTGGAVTSAPVTLTVLPLPAAMANSAYATNILALNPSGYWPMHEVEAPAPGDIETNYGSLGAIANGYYSDWASPNTLLLDHGVPGALAGNTNSCVGFAGQTNACLIIPHSSALATIQTPFTLETWIRPYNDNSYSVIMGQGGGTGLNGSTNLGGFALQYSGTPDTFSLVSWDGVGSAGYEQKTSASYPPTSWYHLVCTFDGTNVTYYVNGNQAGFGTLQSAWPGPMVPDSWSPLVIGGGRWTANGSTHPFAGLIDHVAVYTNILTSSDISQHYNDGANNSVATYEADVQNDDPLLYYRMNSPAYVAPPQSTWPVLTNYGTVSINGVYRPGMVPGGIVGPSESGVSVGGLSGATAMPGNGMGGFADAGIAPTLNPANYTSFSYSAWFKGNPVDNRGFNTIMCVNDTSWRVAINSAGKIQAHGNVDETSPLVYNDGRWHQFVMTAQASAAAGNYTNTLYVDGSQVAFSVNNSTNNNIGQPQEVLIGSSAGTNTSGSFTNTGPAPEGRSFAGNICEAAFFYGTALSSNQVQTLYSSAGVAPFILTQPISASVNATVLFTNSVTVSGGAPFSYQWYRDGQPLPIGGQTNLQTGATNSSLIFNQVQTNDASVDYYVVITNQFGSVTSAVVSLTVFGAPLFTSEPIDFTLTNNILLFSNAAPTFNVAAIGAQPVYYQWYTNGVPATTNGTNLTSFKLPAVQLGGTGATNFFCVASNFLGMTTNNSIGVTGIAAPIAPYPSTVLADNPVNYWRLNEAPDNGSGNAGTIADDYWGGDNGIYTNTPIAQAGYSTATDPSETSAQFGSTVFADSDVYGINGANYSAPTNSNSNFSIEAWVNGFNQTKDAGIVSRGYGGGGEQFDLDTGSDGGTPKFAFRFLVRDASGNTHNANSSIFPAAGSWYHLVGVCNETSGVVALYVNGALAASTTITPGSGILSSTRNTLIGSRPSSSTTHNDDQFIGYVDDVAIYNYALSAAQIGTHYGQAGVPPYFTQLPSASITTNGMASLTIPAALAGTGPMTYQWQDVSGGTNVVTGSTNGPLLNASLTISSLPVTWNGDTLQLTVNNAYGSTNFTVALTLFTNAPVLIQDLPPQVAVVSGHTYAYAPVVIGPQPYSYSWYANNTLIGGETSSTLPVVAGPPGSGTNFFVIVANSFGSVTSSVSAFTSIATNSYAGTVAALNPVGYWPLQEQVPPAPATIETNYGKLGALGNAYYSFTNDASGNQGPQVTLAQSGATSDGDNSVSFTGNAKSYALVPRATPALTLAPPLSLECWVNSSSTAFSDIMGESGAGFDAPANGGNWGGVRLSYGGNDAGGPNLQFYVCNGNGTTRNSIGTPANSLPASQWHHCVATYDGTNAVLYIDGTVQASDGTALAGGNTENPDTWTPFSLGGSFWQTNGGTMLPVRSYAGLLDEVAVYTNVLTSGQVSAHFAAATAGGYPSTIINDGALLYYRMDCQTFTNPPSSQLPIAVNYGSAPVNGAYQSGIVPGEISGPPITTQGANVVSAGINGMFSCVDAGSDPTFNVTGTNKFTVMTWFRAYPADPRVQTVMSHGITNWAMNLDGTTGRIVWNTGNGGNVTSTTVLNDGSWHFLAGVEDGRTNFLYVDGVLNTFAALASTNGLTTEPGAHIYLGGNQDVATVNTSQRYLNGAVAEAAMFTNALTALQVQQVYFGAFSSGAPFIITNVASPFLVMPGGSVTNSIAVIGGQPISYQWQYNGLNLTDNSRVTGSQTNTLALSNAQASDAGNYRVIVTNIFGSVTSRVATLIVGSLPIGMDTTGPGWTANQNIAGFSTMEITNGVLTLTDGAGSEARSFFFQYPQYIGAFKASFTYQAGGSKAADGVAFCIQNDPRGSAALGGAGGSLGVSGIVPSAELELNIYSSEGVGFAFHTNGAVQGYVAPGSVNLQSGDPINVNLNYAAGQMSVTFTDAVASTSFSTNFYTGDLTAVVSNITAYVGFTGADGGSTATQTVTNFSFVSIPPVAFQLSSGGSAQVFWPGAVAGYQLQQNADLTTTNWVNVTNAVILSNNLNQATVPVGGSNLFYRLLLP